MTPTVSVVIPAYNYGRFLGQAIDSVLAQTFPVSEVIVVDDGSTDGTSKVLAHYGDCIRAICQENQGVSMAANRGAELASGDLLAFLDADDVWLPRKLELQVERFLAEPDLGLVHCGYEEIDTKGMVLCQHLDGLEGWVADEMLLFRRSVILGGGSGAIIPRATFLSVGGFDPQVSISQDWDLHYRIACRQKVGFVPEVLLRYRVHSLNRHTNINRMEHDMLLAYAKAFSNADPQLRRLRRRAYGNLHMVLAGSFFTVRQPRDVFRHIMRSLWLTPGNCTRVLGFPLRWWRRRRPSRGAFLIF